MTADLHPAPRYADNAGLGAALVKALGKAVIEVREAHGELTLTVARERVADVMTALRDAHGYQQLMEIAGVDYPDRPERFEVCYHLLSVTKNHRLRIRVTTDESLPVPSVTGIWPNAGWLEREVFDMYGVVFAGNADLRRILTDYGFKGHPFRKDFPLTGYVELRYSEEQKRVVYEPVRLAQDFRQFDFMSPWEGADYILPGDEKASAAPSAPSPPPAPPPAPRPAAGRPAKAPAAKARTAGAKAAPAGRPAEPAAKSAKSAKSATAAKPRASRTPKAKS